MHIRALLLPGLFALLFIVACNGTQEVEETGSESESPASAAQASDKTPGVQGHPWAEFGFASRSDVYLGPQPSEQALEAFSNRGGEVVVNLRTDEGRSNVPWEAEALSRFGLREVRIPVSGASFTKEDAERLGRVIDETEGAVLAHCSSGRRATYLYGAYLVEAVGLSASEAASWCIGHYGQDWEAGTHRLREIAGEAHGADG